MGAASLAAVAHVHVSGVADRASASMALVDRGAVGVRPTADAAYGLRRGAYSDRALCHRERNQLRHVVGGLHAAWLGFWPGDAPNCRARQAVREISRRSNPNRAFDRILGDA